MAREEAEAELKRKQEQELLAAQAQGQGSTTQALGTILDWIKRQEEEKKEEQKRKDKIQELQQQIEEMAKGENRKVCQTTGVNLFANLDAIQGEGTGVNLAAKAQAVMIAVTNAKRRQEDDDASEGESVQSHVSLCSVNKKQKITSGLATKFTQRTVFEVQWAHHWMGKEFEVNPVPFNQIKSNHYMLGEANIMLNCTKPEEMQARLRLMSKLGYWQSKYDWHSVRNVYAAILRGIETGREGWDFSMHDYEDMLVPLSTATMQNKGEKGRKVRDTFFCAAYQRGDCMLESPHMGKVGNDGAEKLVHHVCSSCLLKDGWRMGHANGSVGCPRARN